MKSYKHIVNAHTPLHIPNMFNSCLCNSTFNTWSNISDTFFNNFRKHQSNSRSIKFITFRASKSSIGILGE